MSAPVTPRGFTPFGDDVWLAGDPVRILGMKLTATMTVVRLPDSGLLLHSPVALSKERLDAVHSLGKVTHLYAPNTFHHVWMGDWAREFPEACVHGPAALRKKRKDLRIDRAHDVDSPSDLRDAFDEVHIDGFTLEESVLVHRPSRTLIVADLVHHVGRPEDRWTRLYTKAMGFYDRVAISRMIRFTAFSSRARARASLDRLLNHDFERLVVGHGSPIGHHAREALFGAYAWMTTRGGLLLPGTSSARRGYCG